MSRPSTKQQSALTDYNLNPLCPAPRPDQPVLRFSPTAWAKLLYFCHRGDTEIGGFGISRADDLLLVEDFVTVRQRVTAFSVAFDDAAVADFYETQVDAGRKPEQFSRIWIHTHPGHSPMPSSIDEDTFQRDFGGCTWAIMFILARGGRTYCRLRFNVGPGASMVVPNEVAYTRPFAGSDHAAWRAEFEQNIHPEVFIARGSAMSAFDDARSLDGLHATDGTPSLGADIDSLCADVGWPHAAEFEPPLAADLLDFDPNECEVY